MIKCPKCKGEMVIDDAPFNNEIVSEYVVSGDPTNTMVLAEYNTKCRNCEYTSSVLGIDIKSDDLRRSQLSPEENSKLFG